MKAHVLVEALDRTRTGLVGVPGEAVRVQRRDRAPRDAASGSARTRVVGPGTARSVRQAHRLRGRPVAGVRRAARLRRRGKPAPRRHRSRRRRLTRRRGDAEADGSGAHVQRLAPLRRRSGAPAGKELPRRGVRRRHRPGKRSSARIGHEQLERPRDRRRDGARPHRQDRRTHRVETQHPAFAGRRRLLRVHRERPAASPRSTATPGSARMAAARITPRSSKAGPGTCRHSRSCRRGSLAPRRCRRPGVSCSRHAA